MDRRRRVLVSGAAVVSVMLAGVSSASSLAGTRTEAGKKGASCAGPGKGGDWPVFQHDVSATGFQPKESKIGPDNVGDLVPAWAARVAGTIEAPPVEDGGCVYVGTQEGTVAAFNVENGELVWSVSLPSATTLSIANGRVFAQSSSILTAMDTETGKIDWKKDFTPGAGFGGIGSPLAFDRFVIAGTTSGTMKGGRGSRRAVGYYAIVDQATGKVVTSGFDVTKKDHKRGMEGSGFWSHPSYDREDKYIYFGTSEPRSVSPENPLSDALLKIDADPDRKTFGKIVGNFREPPMNSEAANTPVVGPLWCGPDNPVPAYVSGLTCHEDFDWSSSALIYRDSSGRKLLASPTPNLDPLPRVGGAFVGPPQGRLFGLDPRTRPSSAFGGSKMKAVWSAPTSGVRAAVGAYDGSKIFWPSGFNGQVLAVDKDTGAIVWKSNTLIPNVWEHVAAANGVVYLPGGGFLFAIDARDGTPLLQRPLAPDVAGPAVGTLSAGVAIARNTVFVPVNGAGTAHLVAYRLSS